LKLPPLRLAVLLLVVAAAFAATTGGASATTSCGVKVVDDWYGGHLGKKTYPLYCYREALKIVDSRVDISVYSNARQDILLALQQAIAGRRCVAPCDPTTSLATADALPSFFGGPDAKYGGHAPPDDVPFTLRTTSPTNCPACGVLNTGNSSASSIPLPAIVLGAIAALLLALGSVAYLARRRQLRRQTLLPQAEAGPQNP